MHAAARADDREFARQRAPDLIDGHQVPRQVQSRHAGLEVELEDVARHALLLVEERGLARRPGHDDAMHAGVEMGANVIGKGGAIQLARFVEGRDYRSKHSLQR